MSNLKKSTSSPNINRSIESLQKYETIKPITSNLQKANETKYPTISYLKIVRSSEDPYGPQVLFEAEGIPLRIKSISKEITYFECNSSRQRNSPECNFRGRKNKFNIHVDTGEIEVIRQHSETCKYIIGNKTTDLSQNKNLHPNKVAFKTMKVEIKKN